MPSTVVELARAPDFKEAVRQKIGNIENVSVMSGRVLVATYIAGEKFKGSTLIRPDSNISEDKWQSPVGLVLKKGPLAFQDSDGVSFHGQGVEVGEYVVYRVGDTKRLQINGVECRLIEDTMIDLVIDDPDLITHRSA